MRSGRALPAAEGGALHLLVEATHYALYALVIFAVILGVTNAFVRHYNMLDLVKLSPLGDPEWKKPVTRLHGLAADAMMIVALVHSAAALAHHYVWRDGLNNRMFARGGSVA